MQTTSPTADAILDAAVQLFSEQTGEVTLEDVARRAGVSRQSVYLHFRSRTGLLIAMVQHMDAGQDLSGLLERVHEAPDAVSALDALADVHAGYHPVAYPVARVLMIGRHQDEAISAAWEDRMRARRTLFRAVVERLEREGVLSAEWSIEAATDVLMAQTSWQVWEQLVVDMGWSKRRYRQTLVAVLRRTLLAGGQQERRE
jgi:AcrR family transcriptional regulator